MKATKSKFEKVFKTFLDPYWTGISSFHRLSTPAYFKESIIPFLISSGSIIFHKSSYTFMLLIGAMH